MNSKAKFSVGERVAVCSRSLIVIPIATVIEVSMVNTGDIVTMPDLEERRFMGASVYVYRVDADYGWFGEGCLRRIADDEYEQAQTDTVVIGLTP